MFTFSARGSLFLHMYFYTIGIWIPYYADTHICWYVINIIMVAEYIYGCKYAGIVRQVSTAGWLCAWFYIDRWLLFVVDELPEKTSLKNSFGTS